MIGALLVAIILGGIGVAEDPQEVRIRISAMPLEDGRIEFALQQQGERCAGSEDGIDLLEEEDCDRVVQDWGQRILPRVRKFPSDPRVDRWYSSSPPTLIGDVETRIRARRLADGRTEFALQQKSDGETWGDHILPSSRLLSEAHRTTHLGRWLNSSPVLAASTVVVPEVVVPAGVPVVAEAVLARAELDGWTYNGPEPSFYYGVRQDPLYDTYDTWVIKVSKTDDSLYDTIRLQVYCYSGRFGVTFWEDNLPYVASNSYGYKSVQIRYRFDDHEVEAESWAFLSGNEDEFYPPDGPEFAQRMQNSDRLVIRASFSSHTITATFTGVDEMFQTRVQPNLEYCGHY